MAFNESASICIAVSVSPEIEAPGRFRASKDVVLPLIIDISARANSSRPSVKAPRCFRSSSIFWKNRFLSSVVMLSECSCNTSIAAVIAVMGVLNSWLTCLAKLLR